MYRWIVLAGLLCACSNDADPSSKGGDGEPESDISEARDSAADTGTSGADDDELRVAATVRLLDPYGPRLSGVSVSDVDSEARCTTDDRGECVVDVHRDADFQLSVVEESVLEHRLFGTAGAEGFTMISFVATPQLTNQIYGMLGVVRDRSKGTVVVGLDNPDLSPATGASAAIDAESDLVFVLGARLPESGDTLVAGGSSIVTFVNVPPGPVSVSTTGAEGTTCEVAPAREAETHTVEAVAGAVSVVTFICE